MNDLKSKAATLLGSGVNQGAVASALGVTPAYISQLLADEAFAAEVTDLKYAALSKHNDRDMAYDEIEDSLLKKLGKSLPLILRPAEILGAIKVINGAKRRGLDSQDTIVNQQNIVNIILPAHTARQFTTNIDNQVIKAGDQELITMSSGNLLKTTEEKDLSSQTPALIENLGDAETDIDIDALGGNSLLASL